MSKEQTVNDKISSELVIIQPSKTKQTRVYIYTWYDISKLIEPLNTFSSEVFILSIITLTRSPHHADPRMTDNVDDLFDWCQLMSSQSRSSLQLNSSRSSTRGTWQSISQILLTLHGFWRMPNRNVISLHWLSAPTHACGSCSSDSSVTSTSHSSSRRSLQHSWHGTWTLLITSCCSTVFVSLGYPCPTSE